MALLQPSSITTTRLPLSFPQSLSSSRNLTVLSKQFSNFSRKSISVSACSSPEALPTTEQELLDVVADYDGEMEKNLPTVRSYENDLARLTLIGGVAFEQAVTAAAADGGAAAEEHIASGLSTMVVETLFPGPSDEHSTVSTRLFLPASKVKEKARKLKSTLTADILSSSSSRNILAMTFRQVVLHQLWSFELVLFNPGTRRIMENLEAPREVPAFFTLSSSDEQILSVIAEAVCMCVLENSEKDFLKKSRGTSSNNIFRWFKKPKRYASKDSSVSLYNIFEDEIVGFADNLLKHYNSTKANYRPRKMKTKEKWWTSSTYSKLEKIGGPEFCNWLNEYVPAYRLQVDADKLKNVKLEGWKKSAENRWEVLLSQSQMVGLANILDMYYEDLYTLPDKQLSCGVVADFTSLSKNKKGTSLLKMLSIALASGFILLSISVLAQVHGLRHGTSRKYPSKHVSAPLSEIYGYQHQPLEATKLEALCVLIVEKVKEGFGLRGDIMTDSNVGAWTGELPSYLKVAETDPGQEVVYSKGEDIATQPGPSDRSFSDIETSAQDIASYQVVLSKDGRIIGFQPTSRVAVNHWADNPLSKELYNGRKLSPGLIEPALKISPPAEVVLIELLMSVNPDSWFALARPAR